MVISDGPGGGEGLTVMVTSEGQNGKELIIGHSKR